MKNTESVIGGGRDEAFSLIQEIVSDFESFRTRFVEPSYLESQARVDFIDKFWIALGWDVRHTEQRNPYMQEVRVEASQPSETGRKRPDYAFYLAPEFREPKFFVEAKRPGVDLNDPNHLLQCIRYGWNAGLPLVILHNVAELLVVDSRFRADAGSVGQRVVAKFDLPSLRDDTTFDKLYFLLSREAVGGGSLHAFVDALPTSRRRPSQHGLFKGGYRAIDISFLETLEEWREQLARSLKNRNSWLDGPSLTEVTQRVLDRLVMLRFLQDKGIETRIGIETIAQKGASWGNFQSASRQLDSIYNGIVFKHHPLIDGTKLDVDDASFLQICDELDPRSSEYDFVQIPIQILGSIYERFLGKVIVTTDKRARIEDRPEVRKAGGIYYTPTHIVHYIIDATLDPLVAGKSFGEIKKLRIIDTACGSGSLLIASFEKLIMASAEWFNKNPDKARAAGCIQTESGDWRLSLAQKRELLVSCIYGIDLDHQAIEVAQLSLFLKLLEEESATSTSLGQREFEQALLPSLTYNIINGNALIDVDFYDGDLLPKNDLALKPIPLKRSFPKVFEDGGFHAVVGNPPYLFITEISEEEKGYFQRRYKTTEYRFDIYGLFIERAATEILRPGGRLGYIIPHTLLANDSFEKARRLLLSVGFIDQVVDIGPGVFQGASNETMVFIYENAKPGRRRTQVCVTESKNFPKPAKSFVLKQDLWEKNPKAAWLVHVDADAAQFLKVMDAAKRRLGDLCTVNQGLRTGDNAKYLSTAEMKGGKWERAAGGAEVQRYQPIQDGLWVLYDPALLDAPRKRALFDRPEKIVVQEIRNISLSQRIVATLDRQRTFCLQSTNVIGLKPGIDVDLRFLLGVVNSAVMNHYFRLRFPANNHIASNQLAALPVPLSTPAEEKRIGALVDAVISATEQLLHSMSEHERTALRNRLGALEEQINRAVCNLFGVQQPE
ncbi:Eco57I restriction-modification methylase domain-containing protein [Thiobacillus denitrificans]|uniref:Eco57I restriction-modification methylase domain-containing protein n=1 Tax=Thiobacillus denitrificans TaxID=36861 RepID=UPI00037C8FB9|nr:N-6 DNA methylase [Thiobacillus denitrificans]